MKSRFHFFFGIIFLGIIALSFYQVTPLKPGTKMPKGFSRLKEVNNQYLILKDVYQENGLCVIFSSNTCPFVTSYESRYNTLYELCKKNKIGMLVVNSNEAKRTGDDSYKEMQKHAKEKGYKFYYAEDKSSKLADAFNAQTTPEAFLFDNTQILRYRGAIDDNSKAELVKLNYLQDAIKAMTAKKVIATKETKVTGCSIKRVK
ncbi:MAG: redoxin domain-containing protein [Chitinophagales bacterium]|nr:redoxin domain-containing protein [Chitinophagales bacterium]